MRRRERKGGEGRERKGGRERGGRERGGGLYLQLANAYYFICLLSTSFDYRTEYILQHKHFVRF